MRHGKGGLGPRRRRARGLAEGEDQARGAGDEDAEQGPAPIDLLHQHVLIGGRADLVGELAEVGTGRHQAAGDQQQG
jgi:hypothetical protein